MRAWYWRGVKRKFLAVVAVVLVGTLISAFVLYRITFGPIAPPPTAVTELPGGAFVIPDGYVMAYAVPIGGDKVVLIDAGNDVDAKAIRAALAAKKVTVEAILVTHGHVDHVSGAKAIGAPVLCLDAEAPYVKGDKPHKGPVPRIAGAHGLDIAVARTLKDGDVVTFGDKSFGVYAVPGHTEGSAVFVVDGIAYFGDAASASKEGTVIGPPAIFSDDTAQGVSSLRALAKRLAGVPLTTFAFAHSATLPAKLDLLAAVE